MADLPIDPLLPALVATLDEAGALALSAPPGAGKTTRVPRALLDHGGFGGDIVVLEPRRLAARLAAERVASELGEPVGRTVGFVTRFERAVSPATRIRFVTEGILSRRLLGDPRLDGTSVVLLDEFHERHLPGDVALAWIARLRATTRPDLRVVVMSATLDLDRVAAFLGAPALRSEGRSFPVDLEHLAVKDERPLASQVASAVKRLIDEVEGHVLVFLPGAREIRLASETCAAFARERGIDVLPLHGSLSVAEQDRAVRPSERRKIILSTNVAETSVTIAGVGAVVDSGLALVASVAPWSGLPTLKLAKISRASADQRAGRAGRTQRGVCLRLFTSGDLSTRLLHDLPEIARLDLSETLLELVAAGIPDPTAFGWLDPPDARSAEAAVRLLRRLGAVRSVDRGLAITEEGRRMLRFPVHPRQARMLVEAERRGVSRDGARIAALVGERSIRTERAFAHRGAAERSDLFAALDELDEAEAMRPDSRRRAGFDQNRVAAVVRLATDLQRKLHDEVEVPSSPIAHEDALLATIVSGYPDRVGRLRRPETSTGRAGVEVVLAEGGAALLAESSTVREADLVVAVDAEERTEGMRTRAVVRWASSASVDHLLELFTDDVVDETELAIDERTGRVEEVRRLRFGSLVLDEKRGAPHDLAKAGALLAEEVLRRGASALGERGDASALAARIAFVARQRPELALPKIDAELLRQIVSEACAGMRTVGEAATLDVPGLLLVSLSAEQQRALRELAPERVELPGHRSVTVSYALDAPPSIASRLQDFFGMSDGPSVGGERLVLHLLAPNGRDVQITTDLSGFWKNHYPTVAKELRRRYPRHPWPDDPAHAEPPAVSKPRPKPGTAGAERKRR